MVKTDKNKRLWEHFRLKRVGVPVLGPATGAINLHSLFGRSGRAGVGVSSSGSNSYYVSHTATLSDRASEIMEAL